MLSFRKRKKRTMEIELHDGTKLRIPMPNKDVFDDLKEASKISEPDIVMDDLADLVAAILASNTGKIAVTEEQLRELDLEDIKDFLEEYAAFVTKGLSDPN